MHAAARILALLIIAGTWAGWEVLDRMTPAVASQEAPGRTIAPIGVLQGGPSLTGAQIDAILAGYGSPAAGSGADFYSLGVQYGIDPAYALAFFVEESGAGTDPRWDGLKPGGTTTHDIGNISCAGYSTCYGRWRDYPDWKTGIEDWYRLIRVEYIELRGHTTVDEIIPIYAPAFENDVGGYTNTVSALVGKWRAEYGASSHKCLPTSTGAISAHFNNTDSPFWAGQAGGMHNGTDFSGNPGDPVYAPFDLTVEDIQYYGDAGRIGWYVQGRFTDGYLFYAGHLGTVAVSVGQAVPACTPIGTIGEVFHTHVKINAPGKPEPCEATGCDNFEEYLNER
jgi:murein DD-endopeptidase MepM/ murein hydrolase activator NlpD